jgi:hypothetical protein
VKYFLNFKSLEITGHDFGNVITGFDIITVHKPRLEGTNREGEKVEKGGEGKRKESADYTEFYSLSISSGEKSFLILRLVNLFAFFDFAVDLKPLYCCHLSMGRAV